MSNVEKERDRISFRLRNVDADLREATKGLTTDKLSDLARDGLRLILGIRTTMRVEVAERPIVAATPTKFVTEERRLTPKPTSVFRPSDATFPNKGAR